MIFTSGDMYFTLSTAGITIAFAGVGVAITRSRRRRLLGAALYAAGLTTIAAPAFGLVDALMRYL